MSPVPRRLKSGDRGATAIEYAIIAGLIGLGLVGSLVTTRGSLSDMFGTASSQMGSAGSATPAAPTSNSPRASYWATKTLAGSPVTTVSNGRTEVKYTYTDGTTASLNTGYTDPYATMLFINDTAAMLKTQTIVGTNGVLTQYEHRMFSSTSLTFNAQTSLEYADNSMISNGSIGSTQKYTCSGGTCTNLGVSGPSSGFSAKATTGLQDLRYFTDIRP